MIPEEIKSNDVVNEKQLDEEKVDVYANRCPDAVITKIISNGRGPVVLGNGQ